MTYARIIVDIAHSQVDRLFDYCLPESLLSLTPGTRVEVPFGRSVTEGFIMELSDTTDVPAQKLKSVRRALEERPALLPQLVETAQWMRRQYHCLLVDALRCMVPAEMRGERVREKQIKQAYLAVSPEEAGAAMAALKRAPRQSAALNALLAHPDGIPVCELSAQSGATAAALKELEKKGYLRLEEMRLNRRPAAAKGVIRDEAFSPSDDQRTAIKAVNAAMEQEQPKPFLIHGVTGCGKTEVYMQCAAQALARGRGVMILVPEIALTPQMVQRFTARFGDEAAVLHSRLSAGERYDEWCRIRSGQARVVVGARSAVFAPLAHIGLVVIDEEHEQSYRSEHAPRYDAIEVAAHRCAQENAVLVLASATPSVERYWRANMGEYTLLSMPRRIGSAVLPFVHVVDMRRELKEGNRGVLSRPLVENLETCLSRGEQAILLLNRRGHSSFVSCRECGEVIRCDLCDVSMTYHKAGNMLRCHYCHEEKPVPTVCPYCGSPYIRYFGDGTQKLQEELAQRFPHVSVSRMDADTTAGKDSHLQILERFRRGEDRILVGTQMIAKGLDFPNVTLVGIIAVDSMLFLPDYRSAERAFQLMEQVAGRAGRGSKPGRVVLQTYSPDHFAVKCAQSHDYQAFFDQEITQRRATQYPPFGRILRAVVSSEDEDEAREDAQEIYRRLTREMQDAPDMEASVLFFDVTPAPVARLRAQFRYQVVLKVRADENARKMEDLLFNAMRDLAGSSHAVLETDPSAML
ncbi:MAG: primosomal protein N' [Eubacteriales bacterium]|nr:primosomal protein N' [Eubacteriales bacterium]